MRYGLSIELRFLVGLKSSGRLVGQQSASIVSNTDLMVPSDDEQTRRELTARKGTTIFKISAHYLQIHQSDFHEHSKT